jgi:oxygen-independent coproporphyrinogen-3 oxidase
MTGLAGVLGRDRLGGKELEWTAEANPESFTRELALEWARAGVNRVSLGAQSFQEGPLRWMGRLHGPEGPGEAVARARNAGIMNLSVDLIFGLPEAVPRDWKADLDAALALGVPHLSLYGLTVEEGTPLGRAAASGAVTLVNEERYREEFLSASEFLTEAGYRQYELSNFSLPGFEARHNRAYWELRSYLGLGNSAHSFSFPLRRWNLRDWGEYQNAVRGGRSPVSGQEELTPSELRMEAVWLGLRTDTGLPTGCLSRKGAQLVGEWERRGLAAVEDTRVRLTARGWLLLDRMAVELDSVLDSDPPVP